MSSPTGLGLTYRVHILPYLYSYGFIHHINSEEDEEGESTQRLIDSIMVHFYWLNIVNEPWSYNLFMNDLHLLLCSSVS